MKILGTAALIFGAVFADAVIRVALPVFSDAVNLKAKQK
jgi:hypothetical protein